MNEKMTTLLTSVVGLVGTEAAEKVTTALQSPDVINVVVQILIGVATLWKLIRRKKETPESK